MLWRVDEVLSLCVLLDVNSAMWRVAMTQTAGKGKAFLCSKYWCRRLIDIKTVPTKVPRAASSSQVTAWPHLHNCSLTENPAETGWEASWTACWSIFILSTVHLTPALLCPLSAIPSQVSRVQPCGPDGNSYGYSKCSMQINSWPHSDKTS